MKYILTKKLFESSTTDLNNFLQNVNDYENKMRNHIENGEMGSHIDTYFELFKYISKKLNIDVSLYQYTPKKYIKSLL